tara:strand:+ start:71 stop:532 length:462 start_codon:yes stop_codon:yes gene_type:complete
MNILDKQIEELELNIRVINALKIHRPEIKTIGDLVLMSEGELLRTPGFGRKSLKEVKEVLSLIDLRLDMEIDLERKLHSDMKQINQVRKTDNCYEDLTYDIIKVSEDALIKSFNKIIKKREWDDQKIVEFFNDHERVLNTYKQSLLQLERIVD